MVVDDHSFIPPRAQLDRYAQSLRLPLLLMWFNPTLPEGLLPETDVEGMRQFLSRLFRPRLRKSLFIQVSRMQEALSKTESDTYLPSALGNRWHTGIVDRLGHRDHGAPCCDQDVLDLQDLPDSESLPVGSCVAELTSWHALFQDARFVHPAERHRNTGYLLLLRVSTAEDTSLYFMRSASLALAQILSRDGNVCRPAHMTYFYRDGTH